MSTPLPPWRSVLAVVAHPDDESFGLGAVLSAFAETGATVSVLCFTRGEASTLQGVDGDLARIRDGERRAAASELGIGHVELKSYPDGDLSSVDLTTLAGDVAACIDAVNADGIIGFDADGVTGHPDHRRATQAAHEAARALRLQVLGWTVPAHVAATLNAEFGASFTGHDSSDIDVVVTVDRTRQSKAVACHPSQAVPGSVLWRRLELTGDREYLRHQHTNPDPPPVFPGEQDPTTRKGQRA